MNALDLFSQEFLDEINSPTPRLVYAVRIDYDSPVRAHTGVGDLIINNELYMGVGNLGRIDAINDDNTTSPTSLSMALTGLDPTLVAQILNNRNNNKATRVYWVRLDEDYVAQESVLLFTGKTTLQQYNYDSNDASVVVEAADRLIDWSRKAPQRYSDESHRADPLSLGDRIFRFIAQMAERPIYWGSSKDAPGFRY